MAGVATLLGLLSVSLPAAGALGATTQTGPTWTIEPSPNPVGATASSLADVSCRPDGTCMAVGTYYQPSNHQHALAEVRKGGTWRITPTLNVAGVTSSLLSGVSCAGPATCSAVGYTVSSGTSTAVRGLAEQWDGTTWAIEPTPLPTGATWVSLADVSCPSPNSCIAVGGYIKGGVNAQEQPLAEQWNGMSWSVLTTPNPHAENGSSFNSIDCVGVGECEVVGDYAFADVDQSIIAYSFDGGVWASQKPVNPGGQDINSDNSVSCVTAAACTAVGSWTNNGALGLAQYWDGTSWNRQTLPHPPKSVTNQLSGVSCVAAIACTAVGESGNNLNDFPSFTLVDQWNGTSWQLVPTPSIAGTSDSLAGVSCITPLKCVAVGSSFSTTAGGATLVESSSGP